MLINPISASEFDPTTARTTHLESLSDPLAFRSAMRQAQVGPLKFTQVATNEYRASDTITHDPDSENGHETQDDATDSSLPYSAPWMPFHPTVSLGAVNAPKDLRHLKSIVIDIGIQIVTHIRTVQDAYKTVEFDLPESQIKVKISTIGETSKIQIQTSDPELEKGLTDNKSALVALIKQAIAHDYIELNIEEQSQSGHPNQDNQENDQPSHQLLAEIQSEFSEDAA